MSDFLLVRGIEGSRARAILDDWRSAHAWVRSVQLRDRWEPQELEINKKNAVNLMHGKHKHDLAALILLI